MLWTVFTVILVLLLFLLVLELQRQYAENEDLKRKIDARDDNIKELIRKLEMNECRRERNEKNLQMQIKDLEKKKQVAEDKYDEISLERVSSDQVSLRASENLYTIARNLRGEIMGLEKKAKTDAETIESLSNKIESLSKEIEDLKGNLGFIKEMLEHYPGSKKRKGNQTSRTNCKTFSDCCGSVSS